MLSQRNQSRPVRVAAALVGVAFLSGCMMQNQSAPPLAGPSGYGQSMTITATPDTLPRDGSSMSTITVNLKDGSTDQPLANRRLTVSATAGTLSLSEVVTDVGGNASLTYIAPSLNTPVSKVSVVVTPVGTDASVNRSQAVGILVVGPDVPVASFTFAPGSPAVGTSVNFDGSASTLSGVACTSCAYSWDFGDGTSGSGALVQHAFTGAGVQNVTLSVTSPNGTTGTATRSVVVAAPTPPVANFTVTPASPSAGVAAVLNASASTVGAGASIVKYDWDFGDSSTASATIPNVTHTWAGAGAYFVTLTVTDSLGRTATVTITVTVV